MMTQWGLFQPCDERLANRSHVLNRPHLQASTDAIHPLELTLSSLAWMIALSLSALANCPSNFTFSAANCSSNGTSSASASAANTYRPGVSTWLCARISSMVDD